MGTLISVLKSSGFNYYFKFFSEKENKTIAPSTSQEKTNETQEEMINGVPKKYVDMLRMVE